MKSYPFKTFLLLALILTASFALSDKKKNDPWVPMEERVKIWDEVVSNNDK